MDGLARAIMYLAQATALGTDRGNRLADRIAEEMKTLTKAADYGEATPAPDYEPGWYMSRRNGQEDQPMYWPPADCEALSAFAWSRLHTKPLVPGEMLRKEWREMEQRAEAAEADLVKVRDEMTELQAALGVVTNERDSAQAVVEGHRKAVDDMNRDRNDAIFACKAMEAELANYKSDDYTRGYTDGRMSVDVDARCKEEARAAVIAHDDYARECGEVLPLDPRTWFDRYWADQQGEGDEFSDDEWFDAWCAKYEADRQKGE